MATSVVLVTGLPAAGKSTLARRLGRELGWPVLSLDTVKESLHGQAPTTEPTLLRRQSEAVLWAVAADCPTGVLVDLWVQPGRDDVRVRAAVSALGARAAEIVCMVDAEVAVSRYCGRRRQGPHREADADVLDRIRAAASSWAPLGVGAALTVDTDQPVDLRLVVEWVRGIGLAGSPPSSSPA